MRRKPIMNHKKVAVAALILMAVFMFVLPCIAIASGHGEAADTGWKATDWYKTMNFTALAVGLFLLLRKPVSTALDGRIKGIRDELQDLESKKEAAQKKLDEYTEKLSTLEQEASAIIENYKEQGASARERILADARASAEKIEQQAQRNIENEFEAARQKLQQDILGKAVARAEELVKTTITPDDQSKLVDEYLDKVVAQ